MISRATLLLFAAVVVLVVIFIASIGGDPPEGGSHDAKSVTVPPVSSSSSSSTSSSLSASSSLPTLCILPVGDSLTQGVATYRGYRGFLGQQLSVSSSVAKSLFQRANVSSSSSSSSRSKASIVTVGSEAGTCVIGKPLQIFKQQQCAKTGGGEEETCFSDLLHEGHCSWHMRLLRERVTALMFNQHLSQRKQRPNHLRQTLVALPTQIAAQRKMASVHNCIVKQDMSSLSSASETNLYLRVDVALLLIGHNNVFQVAAFCRMKEGQPLPDSVRLWLRVFDEYDSKIDRALLSALKSSGGKGMLCAWKMLRSEFAQHLFVTVETLLGGEGSVGGGGDDEEATRVVVGLNPPTGFPILDAMVHAVIRAVVTLKQREYSDVSRGANSAVPRIVTASFPGFGEQKGKKHTFDSTHPNDAGAEIIAAGWRRALHELFGKPTSSS